MSECHEIVPIFPVRDLAAAMEHYRRLGFTVSSHDVAYGFAERDRVHIHLAVVPRHNPRTTATAAFLYVGDADALLDEWQKAGVGGRLVATEDTVDGLREGAHVDPDGNLIRFGSWLVSDDA